MFTLIAGLTTGIYSSIIAGCVIVALGLFLLAMLYRFNRRLLRELGEYPAKGEAAPS